MTPDEADRWLDVLERFLSIVCPVLAPFVAVPLGLGLGFLILGPMLRAMWNTR
jgi:hypothetical protein